jgi:hypothetical protein
MTDTIVNLDSIETGYAVFEPDQVLTPDQLNSLAGYLDDQERLSRVALLGVGIACGLWPSLQGGEVRLSHGVGTTTDGDLLVRSGATLYDRYKPYDRTAPKYGPFYADAAMSDDKMITVYELVAEGEKDDRAQPLSGFAAAEGEPLQAMAVVLYVESVLHDDDLCTGTDCDNRGKDCVHATKLLLVDIPSAAKLAVALGTPDAAARALDPVTIARPQLGGVLAAEADLAAIYRNACAALHNDLVAALEELYAPCKDFVQDLAPADPAPRWRATLEQRQADAKDRGIQYYYDFLVDAAETYNAFRDALFGDISVCCPDVAAFPKHLVLGSLDPAQRSASGRTGFYPSPMVSEPFEQRAHARFLLRKLDALIGNFSQPAGPADLRITPSASPARPLEQRAIPYYYGVRDDLPLYRAWSYSLSRRGMERYAYSYNAGLYGAQGGAKAPLASRVDGFDFFRIEGHLGSNVIDTAQKLRDQIQQQNLPIDVETVLLGKDRGKIIVDLPIRNKNLYQFQYLLRSDVAAQLGEATDFSKGFAAQVAAAVDGNVISNADAGTGVEVKGLAANGSDAFAGFAKKASDKLLSASYDMSSKWQDDVFSAAGAAVQLRQTLSPVTKIDFPSPVDAIVTGPQVRWLTWVDTMVQDADDKETDKLFLSAYLAQHPGLEHGAGAPRGGTFVLVHDESNAVVADLALPYTCCQARGETLQPPKLPPFPKPPILVDKPIRVAAFPDKVNFDQFRTQLVNQMKTDVTTQTSYLTGLRDTIGIISGARTGGSVVGGGATAGGGILTGGDVFTGGNAVFQPATSDPVLNVNIDDLAHKSQKVDTLRTALLDPGLDDTKRAAIETQLEASESELSTAIVTTTQYVASTGTDFSAGSDGAKAITAASAALGKVNNIDALTTVEKGLTSVGNQAATTDAARSVIGSLLTTRGIR